MAASKVMVPLQAGGGAEGGPLTARSGREKQRYSEDGCRLVTGCVSGGLRTGRGCACVSAPCGRGEGGGQRRRLTEARRQLHPHSGHGRPDGGVDAHHAPRAGPHLPKGARARGAWSRQGAALTGGRRSDRVAGRVTRPPLKAPPGSRWRRAACGACWRARACRRSPSSPRRSAAWPTSSCCGSLTSWTNGPRRRSGRGTGCVRGAEGLPVARSAHAAVFAGLTLSHAPWFVTSAACRTRLRAAATCGCARRWRRGGSGRGSDALSSKASCPSVCLLKHEHFMASRKPSCAL